jgi:hypothetical protein
MCALLYDFLFVAVCVACVHRKFLHMDVVCDDETGSEEQARRMRAATQQDLCTYLYCRRYRVVRLFMDACQNKGSMHAVVRRLFSHGAQVAANHIEWCVARRCARQEGAGEQSTSRIALLVLAFLSLSDHPAELIMTPQWVDRARRVLDVSCGNVGATLTSPMTLTSQPTPSRLQLATPPTTSKRPREELMTPLSNEPLSEASNSMPPIELTHATPDRGLRTPPPQSPGAPLSMYNREAHFYLRPPYHDVTFIFARMLATNLLNDEEMNRYFGRFGQVGCRRVRCESITLLGTGVWSFDQAVPVGAGASARSASRRGTQNQTWMLQDFVIEIDLAVNALGALVELRDAAILFVAPSHPDRNIFTSSDLDQSLHDMQRERMVLQGDDSDTEDMEGGFVPDLVVDNVPYWFTPEQFSFLCSAHGDVASIRFSIDDRSGAFTGAVLLTMTTSEGTRKAAHGLHGKIIEANHGPLVCGVLNNTFQIESLLDPTNVLLESKYAEPLLRVLRGSAGGDAFDFANPRLWL